MRPLVSLRILTSTSLLLCYTAVLFHTPILEVAHFFSHVVSGHSTHFEIHSINDHGEGHSHEMLQYFYDENGVDKESFQSSSELQTQSFYQICAEVEEMHSLDEEEVIICPSWNRYSPDGHEWDDFIPPQSLV